MPVAEQEAVVRNRVPQRRNQQDHGWCPLPGDSTAQARGTQRKAVPRQLRVNRPTQERALLPYPQGYQGKRRQRPFHSRLQHLQRDLRST